MPNGVLGNPPIVRVRGVNTISGGSSPLIVIDGVVTPKIKLDDINPETIVSMEVLKGNAAITLYGEKGTNGVIIIQTKKEKVKPITQTQFLLQGFKNDGC
jgi:TonB-dependent SusC/RagA subfamily outer membrane receptor